MIFITNPATPDDGEKPKEKKKECHKCGTTMVSCCGAPEKSRLKKPRRAEKGYGRHMAEDRYKKLYT